MDLSSSLFEPLSGIAWKTLSESWIAREIRGAELATGVGTELTAIAATKAQGILVGERVVGVTCVGGGLLAASPAELLADVQRSLRTLANVRGRTPHEYARGLMTEMYELTQTPRFERCLVEIALVFLLGDEHVFVWRVGANGVWAGPPEALRALGGDHRKGAMIQKGFAQASMIPGARLIEETSAMLYVQTPFGYETHLLNRDRSDILMLLNRGAEPLGPRPEAAISSRLLFERDAPWRHGFPSHGAVLSVGAVPDLGWPGSSTSLEIPSVGGGAE